MGLRFGRPKFSKHHSRVSDPITCLNSEDFSQLTTSPEVRMQRHPTPFLLVVFSVVETWGN